MLQVWHSVLNCGSVALSSFKYSAYSPSRCWIFSTCQGMCLNTFERERVESEGSIGLAPRFRLGLGAVEHVGMSEGRSEWMLRAPVLQKCFYKNPLFVLLPCRCPLRCSVQKPDAVAWGGSPVWSSGWNCVPARPVCLNQGGKVLLCTPALCWFCKWALWQF